MDITVLIPNGQGPFKVPLNQPLNLTQSIFLKSAKLQSAQDMSTTFLCLRDLNANSDICIPQSEWVSSMEGPSKPARRHFHVIHDGKFEYSIPDRVPVSESKITHLHIELFGSDGETPLTINGPSSIVFRID